MFKPTDQLPDILGYLVWYSVENETSVSYETFRELIKEHEAPLTIMKRPKPENVFRRACEKFKFENISNTGAETYTIVDNGFNKELVSRNLIFTTEKLDGKITTEALAQVTLNKKSKDIEWEVLIHGYMPICLQEGIDEAKKFIADYMLENAELLYSLPIRESIRRAIEGPLHGISMKPAAGAVYFIPHGLGDDLMGMCKVLKEIDGAQLDYMMATPDPYHLELVETYYVDYSLNKVSEINTALLTLGKLLDAGETVPAKKFTEIQELIDAYNEHTASYDWYLDADLTAQAGDKLKKRLDDLLSKVSTDE